MQSSVFLSAWIPPEERAWASTQLDTGITIGTLAITLLAGFLGATTEWRDTYYLIGTAGLLFTAIWQLFAEASQRIANGFPKRKKDSLKRKSQDRKTQRSSHPTRRTKRPNDQVTPQGGPRDAAILCVDDAAPEPARNLSKPHGV